MRLWPHQLQWYDIMEGREPRDMHPSMSFTPGRGPTRIVVNVPPSHAKALALDTPVPTPTGWTTIGDLRVGDKVLHPRLGPVAVTAKSHVFTDRDCYRVTSDDGWSVVADKGHLWEATLPDSGTPKPDRPGKTGPKPKRRIYTTEVLARPRAKRPSIALTAPIDLPEADLLVDPWVLGAWLGDGASADGRISCHPDDQPYMRARFEDAGYETTDVAAPQAFGTRGLYRDLRLLGVLGNKHIPQQYLRGSAKQRLSLLQGLIDTDGHVTPTGQTQISLTNERLARGLAEIVHSLGTKARVSEVRATFEGRDCGPLWQVTFYMVGSAAMPRKDHGRLPEKCSRKRYLTVERCESVPTQCITVDAKDGLFLAGRGMLVTHNSTTLTVAYSVWRIVKNPDVKIAIVSKKGLFAQQFLLQIKERLTSPQYEKLQAAFAPPGGWSANSASWRADQIYVSSDIRSAEQKDPTVQAIGIRSALYGARLDLAILDDCIDNVNVADYAKQVDWVQGIVSSRLAPRTGRVMVIGTRIASKDLYSELLNPDNYFSGESPWRHFTQPAVLEYAEEPRDWVTLWPQADRPADPEEEAEPNGLYRRWDGETLAEIRDSMPPALWSRMYQQEQVAEDAVFRPEDIQACRGGYPAGRLTDDESLGRAGGTNGLRIIAGLDPAVTGYTAAVCVGLDIKTNHRWIIDVYNKANCAPDEIRHLMKHWTDKHGVQEWRVEKNSFQGFLTQDTEIRNFLATRGSLLTDHFTSGQNKHDPNFGVAAMAALFSQRLITTPTHHAPAMQAMVEQLVSWAPATGRKQTFKTDIVMALWFAELRCQELCARKSGATHRRNMYQTRLDRARQVTVPAEQLGELAAAGAWWR